MVYSQAKVIAGGLAHIPIVISVFYFIMTTFNKRALEFAEANKSIKIKSKVLESKTEVKPLIEVKEPKAGAIKEISNKLKEIEKKAEDVKEKVKKKQKNEKKKKKKDMKRD